jgi:hypothetical protein
VDAGDREEINLHLKFTIVKSLKIFLFFSAIFGLLFYSCGKDCTDKSNPECSNYEPCYGKTATNANFKTLVYCGDTLVEATIGTNVFTEWHLMPDDTTADEYLWEIEGKFYTNKTITIHSFSKDGEIPIKLTVKNKNSNKNCFFDDKGIDVKEKNIVLENYYNFVYSYVDSTSPKNTKHKTLNGNFKGYNKSNSNNIFTISFKLLYDFQWIRGAPAYYNANLRLPFFDLINLPYKNKGIINTFLEPKGVNYSTFTYNSIAPYSPEVLFFKTENLYSYYNESPFAKYYSYFMIKAILHPTNKDKITIIYEFFNPETQKRESDVFYGTRL